MKDAKAKELCIPSFVSVLFGITEPALFGVNIRYRYPLAGGCIGVQSEAQLYILQTLQHLDLEQL